MTRAGWLVALAACTGTDVVATPSQDDLGLGFDAPGSAAAALVPAVFWGNGTLGGSDVDDFFAVELGSSQTVDAVLTEPAEAELDLTLLDSSGTQLATAPSEVTGVASGRAVVHVRLLDGGGDYGLELRVISADFEAEAGALTPAFHTVNDATASGGVYVVDGNANGASGPGAATYAFTLEDHGPRQLYLRGSGRPQDNSTNSFYVSFDDGGVSTWDQPVCGDANTWRDSYASDVRTGDCATQLTPLWWSLAPGPHTLTLSEREGQSTVDRLWLQEWPPDAGPGSAELTVGCSSTAGPAALWAAGCALRRRRSRKRAAVANGGA